MPAPVSCGGCSRYVVDRAKKVIADKDDGAEGSASDDAEAGGSGVGEVERKAGSGKKPRRATSPALERKPTTRNPLLRIPKTSRR